MAKSKSLLNLIGWHEINTKHNKKEILFFYPNSIWIDYLMLVIYSWTCPSFFNNCVFIINSFSHRYTYLVYLMNCEIVFTVPNNHQQYFRDAQKSGKHIITLYSGRYLRRLSTCDQFSGYSGRIMTFDYRLNYCYISNPVSIISDNEETFRRLLTNLTPYNIKKYPFKCVPGEPSLIMHSDFFDMLLWILVLYFVVFDLIN